MRDSVVDEGDDRSVFPGFGADELIDRLAALRRRRGLSQTEVAARMGTSQSALARLEARRTDARMSTVARYAAALDADVGFAVEPRDQIGDGDETGR